MDRLTLIEDFRKLEEALGKESSALLIKILDRREEMLLDKLATKEDLAHLEKRVEAKNWQHGLENGRSADFTSRSDRSAVEIDMNPSPPSGEIPNSKS